MRSWSRVLVWASVVVEGVPQLIGCSARKVPIVGISCRRRGRRLPGRPCGLLVNVARGVTPWRT